MSAAGARAIAYLAAVVDSHFPEPRVPIEPNPYTDRCRERRALWLDFVAVVEFEGFFDRLNETDGLLVAYAVVVDLSKNADGSHFLRWRAEQLREGNTEAITEDTELNDPEAIAEVLEAIARLVGTKPRIQT